MERPQPPMQREREERPAPAPVTAPVPRIDPKEALESAGLVMIETDRSKATAVIAPPAEEPMHLGRPRRERPRHTPQEDELQQVETRK
jgi:hypothetical protein